LRQLLYGLALVLIMLYRPSGLWLALRHEDQPEAGGDRLEKISDVVQA
jgi:branched-chain amino acid transport system permease protein